MPRKPNRQLNFLLAREAQDPEIWRVEMINRDQDGGCEETLFSGPQARERAMRYVKAEYGVEVDPAGEDKVWLTLSPICEAVRRPYW